MFSSPSWVRLLSLLAARGAIVQVYAPTTHSNRLVGTVEEVPSTVVRHAASVDRRPLLGYLRIALLVIFHADRHHWLVLGPSPLAIVTGIILRLRRATYDVYLAADQGMMRSEDPMWRPSWWAGRLADWMLAGAHIVWRRGGARFASQGPVPNRTRRAPTLTSTSESCLVHREPQGAARGVRVLFVGALLERKGVRALIDGFEQFAKSSNDAELLVAGMGPLADDVAAAARIDSRIYYYGFVNDSSQLCDLYTRADILVLPSLTEGQPRVLTEAGLHGCALVSTSHEGITTTFANAVLYVDGSPESIRDALLRFGASRALLDRYRRRAFAAAHRDVEGLETFLAHLLAA